MNRIKLLLCVTMLGVFGFSVHALFAEEAPVVGQDMCNCQTTNDCTVYNKNAVCSFDSCATSGNNTHVCALSDPPKSDE